MNIFGGYYYDDQYRCLYHGKTNDMIICLWFDFEEMEIITAYPYNPKRTEKERLRKEKSDRMEEFFESERNRPYYMPKSKGE
jgi:hypothetical protein